MPFTATGTDIEMQSDPRTGRLTFDWDSFGNPKYGDTRAHAVASLLIERRGQWAQDATGTRGSVLHTIRNDRARTASDLETAARDALEPLTRSGAIHDVKATATRLGSGVYKLRVTYTTAGGVPGAVEV